MKGNYNHGGENVPDPYLEEESSQKEDFYIYLAREKTVHSEWSSFVTTFPYYRLYYVTEAEDAVIKLKSETIVLRSGWVYYIPAYLIRTGSCKTLNHIFIHFLPNPGLKSVLDKINTAYGYAATEDDEKLFRNIMRNSVKSSEDSAFLINGSMYLLLGKILSQIKEPENEEKKIFDPVIEYIEKNISKTFSLDVLAGIINYNKAYFAHKFKKVFGISPMQYVNNKKISLACKMLSRFDVPIQTICFGLGFSSESYFTRLFKLKTGKNPTAYRLSMQNAAKGKKKTIRSDI